MNYSEFHNHKWAANLAHARQLWQQGQFETLYRGEDLPDGDIYPGLRVMAAYWASVEHEMPTRLKFLLKGSGQAELLNDPQIQAKSELYLHHYLDDMRTLIQRHSILPMECFEAMIQTGLALPEAWAEAMRTRQQVSEAALTNGQFSAELLEAWLLGCLRSVANYNRYLIQGAVLAAALVQRQGQPALQAAVDATAEDFMWEISRVFYATALPQAGFEDIGDLMELGLRGMFADQWYQSGGERQEGEATIRTSILKNCELAGIFNSITVWEGLPTHSLGYGICRYCEVHGAATMMISMPPMVSPSYQRIQSFAMDGKECIFELTTVPADDMARILTVQEKVFGES